jgi:integral membrane protein
LKKILYTIYKSYQKNIKHVQENPNFGFLVKGEVMLQSTIGRLRIIGFIEGLSYLILLFIAMPLKYFADLPQAVSVVGMLHGVLFVAFILAVLHAAIVKRWSFFKLAGAGLASIVPFGTFVLDKQLQRDM